MTSLGGGRSHCRRPGSCYRALSLLLILLTASAIDGVFSGGPRNTGNLSNLFTELQIRASLTLASRSISVHDRRPLIPPSTPKKSSTLHSTMVLRVRVYIFTTSMTISPRLIVGHGQSVHLGGRTFKPHLLSFTRVRYGRNLSTYCIFNLNTLFRVGCLNLNGNHGGVPDSVNSFAQNPGRSNQKTLPILDRFYHSVLCTEVLYRFSFGPDTVIGRPNSPGTVTIVIIPAFIISSARASILPSKANQSELFLGSGGWEGEGARNPNGFDGPLGLFADFNLPVWWALKLNPNLQSEFFYAGPRSLLLFSGPVSLCLIESLGFKSFQLYASNPLVRSQGFVLKNVMP